MAGARRARTRGKNDQHINSFPRRIGPALADSIRFNLLLEGG